MTKTRKFIEEKFNEGFPVQVACSYTNTGICSVYLTTSGRVCREEFGFVEDRDYDVKVDDTGREIKELKLKTRSWSSIKRLQRYLLTN